MAVGRRRWARRIGSAALGLLLIGHARAQDAIGRGGYLAVAAGCIDCHSDPSAGTRRLGGGGAMVTAVGTFWPPNISPDQSAGIGAWSDRDFIRALRHGIAPDGHRYYPAFPYTTFTLMSDQDLLDIKAWLFAQPPVAAQSHPPSVSLLYRLPGGLALWQWLALTPGPFIGDEHQSDLWNRGAYLVNAVAGCGECHTPRTRWGAIDRNHWLEGARPVEGLPAPALTGETTALGRWTTEDVMILLRDGVTINGDLVRGGMARVAGETAQLSDSDRRAIAIYLKSLPAAAGSDSGADQRPR